MKNHIVLLSLTLFNFLSCSSGQSKEQYTTANNEDIIIENGNSLLWKVEGNDSKTSYMYGTMHIIDEEYYCFSDAMKKKIESSEAILMEVGGIPNPLETLNLISLDSGDIRDQFTEEQMTLIVEFFDQELNTSPEKFYKQYGQMKPFFLLQAITQNYFSDNTMSYDMEIMGIAAQNNIPLIGFETIQQQLGFFDIIPSEKMALMVTESIKNFEKEKKETLKMMKIYSEQKVKKLIPMIQKQSPEFMEFSDVFLYNRNKAWIPRIKEEIASKKCFIAVGAAHLFGNEGLISLLKKEGFKLTAISTEN